MPNGIPRLSIYRFLSGIQLRHPSTKEQYFPSNQTIFQIHTRLSIQHGYVPQQDTTQYEKVTLRRVKHTMKPIQKEDPTQLKQALT